MGSRRASKRPQSDSLRAPRRRARLRRVLKQIYTAAIDAADPAAAVRAHVHVDGARAHLDGVPVAPAGTPWHVLALGKAATPMAQALVALGGAPVAGGVLVTKHGHGASVPGLACYEAGHPVPDAASVTSAAAVLAYARERVAPGDLVWVAISGGTSAVCCAPAPGVSLRDKQRTTDLLLRASVPIAEINTVRKHLSVIKGGRLAEALAHARTATLLVSDVIGDDPGTIGSGLTAPDDTTFADAVAVLRAADLWAQIPPAVRKHLNAGRRGARADTPSSGHPAFRGRATSIVASNRDAIAAAARAAAEAGYAPLVLSTSLGGETREVAAMHAAVVREICESGRPGAPPVAILSGGETVVNLGAAKGKGGRAQEFTLAFLDSLGPVGREVAVACVGTDGTDGPTDAAGAVGDDHTLARAAALGLPRPKSVLNRHDTYPWFARLEDLVRTGPTGTNVMDVRIALVP